VWRSQHRQQGRSRASLLRESSSMAQKFSLSYWTRACQCSSRIKILLDRMISTSNFYLFVHFLKSRQPTQFRLETIQRDRISTCFWVKSFDQVVRDSKISVPAEILRCLPTCQAFPTNFKNLNTYKCRTFDAESYGIHITFPIKTFLGTSYKKNPKLSHFKHSKLFQQQFVISSIQT